MKNTRVKKNKRARTMKKGGSKYTEKASRKSRMHTYKHINNSHIVKVFLEMLNTVKLFHWRTHSFAQHKATDELYEKLNEDIDEFIEVLMGKDGSRIKLMEKRIDLIDPSNLRDFKARIYEYRTFLTDFNMHFDAKKDSDLLSIRDTILGHINQFLYLSTLSA